MDGEGIVDALYTRFVLRDVFGKIIPGAVVLLGIATLRGDDWLAIAAGVGFLGGVLLVGVAWLVGYFVQHLGLWSGLTKADARDDGPDAQRYARRLLIFQQANEREFHQLERFTILKEATGNAHVALLLAVPLAALGLALRGELLPPDAAGFAVLATQAAVLGLAFVVLRVANRDHRHKQRQWELALERAYAGRPVKVDATATTRTADAKPPG